MSSLVQATPPFPLAGELASLGAAFIWACAMALYTGPAKGIPAQTMNLYKNLVAVLCLVAAIVMIDPPTPTDTHAILLLALSGIVGITIGDTAFFAALKHLGAQVSSATQCLAPPVSALLAAWAWHEMLSPLEIVGLTLTLFAVMAIIYFGKKEGAAISHLTRQELLLGVGLATISALCQALGVVIARQALQEVHILHGTLLRIGPAVMVLMLTGFISPQGIGLGAILRKPGQAIRLGIAAFAGAFLGLLLMTIGTKYSKAGISSALSSTYPIWIIPFARLYLGEKGNWQSVICTVVAVGGIAFMLL